MTSPAAATEKTTAKRRSAKAARDWDRYGMAKSLKRSILHLLEQLAQQPADPLEDSSRRAWILFRRSQDLGFRKPWLHLARARPGGPPAGSGSLRSRLAARRAQG